MKFFLLLFLVGFTPAVVAQEIIMAPQEISTQPSTDSAKLKVGKINITGNKKTKSYIIEREMKFKAGEYTYAPHIAINLELSRQLIYNTNLFSEVMVQPVFKENSTIDIYVTVREKWYLYPTPQFQLVDRNFNEWANIYNYSLSRVIYGLRFVHYNFSGRRDQLRFILLNGYARNFAVQYSAPYSNSKLDEGFGFSAGYTQNREISFGTSANNKLLQYNNQNKFVRNTFQAYGYYSSRKGYFSRHRYQAGYTYMQVADSVVKHYNPFYFNDASSHQNIIDLSYNYSYLNVNNINYPLTGKTFGVSILKRGLGIKEGVNLFSIDAAYNRYFNINKGWYGSVELWSRIKLPFNQPYINRRALGYGDLNLRGLEYYVIDGSVASMAKFTVRKKIFDFKIPFPIKNKIVPYIPFSFYAKAFGDAGYVYSQQDARAMLNNKLLYTGGVGLDVITLYDVTVRLDYSFNQLGEKGLFLHLTGGF